MNKRTGNLLFALLAGLELALVVIGFDVGGGEGAAIVLLFIAIVAIILLLFRDYRRQTEMSGKEERSLLKRRLTQNIAHELKTPVASIFASLETIVNDPEMDEATKNEFIRRCYSQSSRLSNLVRDISLLTRLDGAPQDFEKQKLNLYDMTEAVKGEFENALADKGMQMLNMLSKDNVIFGNESLVHSIFANLTDNAIAYAGEGAIIRVRLMAKEGNMLSISFEDNGRGVPPEHLKQLFDRFYRVDKGRSRKLGGTGLGLAIVKNAVILHGGSVYAANADTGGLQVVFSLPEK